MSVSVFAADDHRIFRRGLCEIMGEEDDVRLVGYDDGSGNPDPTQVTDTDLETYTLAATSRPPGFVEAYATSWPLEGGLGPGSIIRTAEGSELRLAPYHRSNPFRHAFHRGERGVRGSR